VISDFDILLLIKSKEKNHRMFFSHSIFFSGTILLLALLTSQWWLFFCGIGALIHVCIDMMDWGTNLLFTKRIIGPRFLLKRDEWDNVPGLMKKEFAPKYFFVKRYFGSIPFQLLEILAGLGMILCFVFLVPSYWYAVFGYVLVLGYHLFEFFELRYRTKHQKSRYKLVNH
ncbi:MAG: hypothetical protein ACTSYI_00835, partial [Promethearchaeota archaeon]